MGGGDGAGGDEAGGGAGGGGGSSRVNEVQRNVGSLRIDRLFSGSGTGVDGGVGTRGGEGTGTGSWGASGEVATGGRAIETSTFGGLGGSSSINRRGVLITREERALTTGIINCRIFFKKVVLLGATVGLSSGELPVVVLGFGVGEKVPSGTDRAASRSARWLGVRGGRPLFLEHVAGTTRGGDSSCFSEAGCGEGEGGGGGETGGGRGDAGGGDSAGGGRGGGGEGAGGVKGGDDSFASSFSLTSITSSSVTAVSVSSSLSSVLSSFSSFSSSSSSSFCSGFFQQGSPSCSSSSFLWGVSCHFSPC